MTLLVVSPVCLIMAAVALLLHHRTASLQHIVPPTDPPPPMGVLPLVNDLPGCVCDEQAEAALLVEEQWCLGWLPAPPACVVSLCILHLWSHSGCFLFFLSSRSICQPDADLAQVRQGEGGAAVERGDCLDHVVIYPDLSLLVTRQKKKGISERVTLERKESDVWMAKRKMGWKDSESSLKG